ncbi:MAG: carbohydrate esterase, sialic acid-specific acetylesterase [Ignavibacteria bacterium]|nr:carbohydrate esterase, sialic acid-specific acetylesterase [Ignavibacteria bacterium]
MKYFYITIALLLVSINLNAENIWWKEINIPDKMKNIYHMIGIKEKDDGSIFWIFSFVDSIVDHEIPALMKTDKDGNVNWLFYKSYDKKVIPNYIQVNENGEIIYHCIWVRIFGVDDNIDFRPLVIKLNKKGEFIEDYVDSASPVERFKTFWYQGSFVENNDKNIINFTFLYRNKNNYFYINKWDSLCNFQQQIMFDSVSYSFEPGKDKTFYIPFAIRTNDDGYLLRIACFTYSGKRFGGYYLKLDKDFKKEWEIIPFDDDPLIYYEDYKTILLKNNDFAVISKTIPISVADSQKYGLNIRRFDMKGKLISNTYNYSKGNFYINDFIEDSDGGFAIVGDSNDLKTKSSTIFYLLKTNIKGEIINSKFWDLGGRTHSLKKLALSNDKNYFVMANRWDNKGYYQFYYAKLNSIITSVEEQVDYNKTLLIFPNPASVIITIHLGLQGGTVAIYDLLGEKVYESKIEGDNPLNIDVSEWQCGVYLCVFRNINGTITEKIVIAR